MLNRREFLATGLVATVSAQALPGDKMRFAMSGHQFRATQPHPERGIQMTAAYGYHGIEPFQDVSADGQRFVMISPIREGDDGEVAPPSIRVVQNWYEEFRDREE